MTTISPAMVSAVGAITFTDHSIAALTDGQAAGTDPILPANTTRRALVIIAPVAGRLAIAPNGLGGWKLQGGLESRWTGQETPRGDLYAIGLPAGQPLSILEG